MQRIKTQILVLFAALTLALGGTGAFIATQNATGSTDTASAHTFVVAVACGTISPTRQIQIAYHPYTGAPYHNTYWRAMTAAEYWYWCH